MGKKRLVGNKEVFDYFRAST